LSPHRGQIILSLNDPSTHLRLLTDDMHNSDNSRGHSVQPITPPRHVEIGTMSLPAWRVTVTSRLRN